VKFVGGQVLDIREVLQEQAGF